MYFGLFLIIIFLLYFILKSIKDVISFHFWQSIFSKVPEKYMKYVNPSISWKNKWKNGDKNQGEKFWGSSTIFVMFTDLWHFCDFLQILILTTAICLLFVSGGIELYIAIAILYGLGSGLFEVLFSNVLKK